jgi:hypothetical protein
LPLPPPQAARLPSTARRNRKPARHNTRRLGRHTPKSSIMASTAPANQPSWVGSGIIGVGPREAGLKSPPELLGAVELMAITAVTVAVPEMLTDGGMVQVGG